MLDPQRSPLALYSYLSDNGPKGLREVAADLYDGDVITAREHLRHLEGEDLIAMTPEATGFSRSDQMPRKWKVIDPK